MQLAIRAIRYWSNSLYVLFKRLFMLKSVLMFLLKCIIRKKSSAYALNFISL